MLAYLDDLSRSNPRRAADQIREAMVLHGERPELLLREALVELESANPEVTAAAVNRIRVKSHQHFDTLLGEIDARIKIAGSRIRSDLHTCAEALEWQVSGKLKPGDEVRVLAEIDGLTLEARLAHAPEGAPVTNTANLRKAPIYVEDTPSLNNLDWTKSPQAALDYVHSHDLGTVVRLPRAEIAHYRPKVITVSSESRRYRATSTMSDTNAIAKASRISFQVWSTSARGSDDDDDDEEAFVYLVIAKPAIAKATAS
jgi:hypothetical protein